MSAYSWVGEMERQLAGEMVDELGEQNVDDSASLMADLTVALKVE